MIVSPVEEKRGKLAENSLEIGGSEEKPEKTGEILDDFNENSAKLDNFPKNQPKVEKTLENAKIPTNSAAEALENGLKLREIGDLFEEELSNYLENYKSTVSDALLSTFPINIESLVQRSRSEDLTFLEYFHENLQNPLGLAIIHADAGFLAYKRLGILHFSLNSQVFQGNSVENAQKSLENAVDLLLKWLWTRDNCEEIRVNLYHSANVATNELEVDKNMQKVFVSQGFRWKLLTNDKLSGTRFTIFGLKRPISSVFSLGNTQSEPIIYRSCVILAPNPGNSQENGGNLHETQGNLGFYDNIHCQLAAFASFSQENAGNLPEMLGNLLENVRNQPNFVFQGTKVQSFESFQGVHEFLKENDFAEVGENAQKVKLLQGLEGKTVCALLKACYRWENFRTSEAQIQGKTMKFLRISPVKRDFL